MNSINYNLVFDEVILKQLKKTEKNKQIKEILSKMFNKIEEKGSDAGQLIDSRLQIFEMKSKYPPVRLYYKLGKNNDIYIFEYEMKTSEKKQKNTIEKIKDKISRILHLLL